MYVYSFYADVLDRNDKVKFRLEEALYGNITYNQGSVAHVGGTIHAETEPDKTLNINLQSDRMRVYFRDSQPYTDVGTVDTLMGTFLIAAPDVKNTRGVVGWSDVGPRQIYDLVLLDKITILNEFAFPYAYTVKKGVNTAEAVRTVIRAATGESNSSIEFTPSSKVIKEDRVWDIGTTALQIVNDLLASIDYWAVRCSPGGKYIVEPYVLPKDRAVVHTFDESNWRNHLHTDDWTRTREISSVPNRFTVYSTGTEDEKGYTGVARNQDPDSPFSYQARGRWIDQVESVNEFATQGDADKLAARRLKDVSAPVSNVTITHAYRPMNLHDRVRFRWENENFTGTVYAMSINLGKPDLMTTTLREIL